MAVGDLGAGKEKLCIEDGGKRLFSCQSTEAKEQFTANEAHSPMLTSTTGCLNHLSDEPATERRRSGMVF